MNQKVLITGATSGIGYEFAHLYAKDGCDISIHGRDIDRLYSLKEELNTEYNVHVDVISCDLSSSVSVDKLVEYLSNKDFDIFINNAGFDVAGDFIDNAYEKEFDMISVNILAHTRLAKVVARNMVKNGSGRILNLGSIVSYIPVPHHTIYSATKAYVLNYSLGLREELKNTGVTVSVLCPGPTKTNFAKRANLEKTPAFSKNILDTKFVATQGYNGLIKGKAVMLPGLKVKTYVLLSKIIPMSLLLKLSSKAVTPR